MLGEGGAFAGTMDQRHLLADACKHGRAPKPCPQDPGIGGEGAFSLSVVKVIIPPYSQEQGPVTVSALLPLITEPPSCGVGQAEPRGLMASQPGSFDE